MNIHWLTKEFQYWRPAHEIEHGRSDQDKVFSPRVNSYSEKWTARVNSYSENREVDSQSAVNFETQFLGILIYDGRYKLRRSNSISIIYKLKAEYLL